jgi:hypothetical protein
VDEDHCIDSELMDHLDLAWGVIANVGTGFDGWEGQDGVWVKAASEWRAGYERLIDRFNQVSEARRG